MRFGRLSTLSVLVIVTALALAGCFGPAPAGSLTGVVERDAGEKLVGVTVKLGAMSTTTDENGAFSFEEIRPSLYTLAVLDDDELLFQEQIRIAPGQNVYNLTISEPKGTIQGVVLSRAGRPFVGAKVSVGTVEVTTDEAGGFVLANLPLGSYQLTVTMGDQELAAPITVNLDEPEVIELDPIVGTRNVALGKSYTYEFKSPHPSYPDTDLKEMTDGIIGPNSYSNPAWTAVWYNDTFLITFDLEEQVNVYEVRIHMLAGTAGIYYPSRFTVSVSNDGSTWTPVAELNVTDPQPTQSQVKWFEIDEIDAAGRYVRLSITFDPEVSNGGGHNMFLSEVEIYE